MHLSIRHLILLSSALARRLLILPALVLLPGSGSAQEGPYLKTATAGYYTLGREQFETTATSLADAITDPYASASVKVHYGSATASARLNAPTNSGEDLCHVDGYWQDEFTVNNPALTGQTGIARFTVHLTGGISGSWSGDAANGVVSYGALVGGFFATGSLTRDGRIENNPGTFTVDAQFTYGVPGNTPRFLLVVQVDGAGGIDTHEGSAVETADFTLSSSGFAVLNDQNQPQAFTSEARSGSARASNIAPGGAFSGFTLTNGAPGRLGTSLILRDGTASAAENVTATFVAPPPPTDVQLVSDAVDLSGTGSDPVVVQMSYDPVVAAALTFAETALRLAWLDPVTNKWLNAVAGNSGGTAKSLARGYNPLTDFHLGNFGVDIVNRIVWAVVNHNSEFGVTAIPDFVLLRVPVLTHPALHTFHLQCMGVPNVLNRIESSPDLSLGSFTPLASVMADVAGAFSYDDATSVTQKYYRLAIP